jgi:hypothetical protein
MTLPCTFGRNDHLFVITAAARACTLDLSAIARYEWLILLGLPLALLLWELRNIRREIRRARENDEAKG